MMEQDYQGYKEMSPEDLKGEFLTIFGMLPKGQPMGNLGARERNRVRFELLGRLARIMERSAFSRAGQEYFRDQRFYNYWVKGFDSASLRGASFSLVLDRVREPEFDITNRDYTRTVELAGFVDLNMQLGEVKKSKPRNYVAEADKRHEIEVLEGLSERWRSDFAYKYSEEIPLPKSL